MAESQLPHTQQICVCGGGNAAHVFAVLGGAMPNTRVNVLSLFQDEHERWRTAMTANGGTTITFKATDTTVTSTPDLVTNDPAAAIPGSDLIIISIPMFAHDQYLRAIAEHSNKPAVIAIFPGGAGVGFQFKSIFGDRVNNYALISCETLPWACRIQEYGRAVEVLGTKHEVGISTLISDAFADKNPIGMASALIGEQPVLRNDGNIIQSSLGVIGPVVHTAIMFSFWAREWNGEPLDEKPLFYQGISRAGADTMAALSSECLAITAGVKEAMPSLEFQVNHVQDWYMTCYGADCTDTSSLYGLITTNPGYAGLTHPCVETEDGKFLPNYNYRYLTQEVPFGLVVFKGIALVVGVATPVIDEILLWAQKALGREYLTADGLLNGGDVANSRAPQAYGFETLQQML